MTAGAVAFGLSNEWFAVAATALVLLAVWLRPWRLLAVDAGRLLAWRSARRAQSSQRDTQAVRRRRFCLLTVRTARRAARRTRNHGEPTLTGPIPYRLPLRDLLFRAHGWLAGAALGVWIALRVDDALRWPLFATRFEALTDVLASCAGLLAGVGTAWALDRFPARAATGRLKGPIDGRAANAMLEFGASALTCLFALALGGLLIQLIQLFQLGWWATGAPSALRLPGTAMFALPLVSLAALPGTATFALPLVSLAALAGYALPWLVRRRMPVVQRALWIVVAGRPSMSGGFMVPHLQLIDALAPRWRDGPVTVLLDAAIEARGEHALAAERAGQPRQLYPALAVEIADWAQAVPPAERWTSLPVREMHPASALMVPALKRFIQPGDVVVLIARSTGALAPWRDALRHTRCLVAWLGPQTAALNSIAGFAAIPVRAAGLLGDAAKVYARIHEALTGTVVASPAPAVLPVTAVLVTPAAQSPPEPSTPEAATNEPVPAAAEQSDASVTTKAAGTVFISYSHVYRDLMQALVRELESIGVGVRHDGLLTAGQPWSVALAAMLESSDAVVAIIGPPTAASHHQSAEIERAIKLGKLFIPVFVAHFKEPQAALAFMAANLDGDGRIRYLADCTPDETTAVLRTSAQRIAAALAGNSASAAEQSHNQAGSVPAAVPVAETNTLLTLTITMRTPGRLDFVALDTSRRAEWFLAYQPKLIESVAASLRRGPWNVDAARTLSSRLLPSELRTLVSQAPGIRLHLVTDRKSADFPWEVVFGLVTGSVVPVSVVRRMHDAARPPVRRPGAAVAAALLISNPSTRGAQTGLGLAGELPPLRGTEVECRAVEAILRRVGYTVTHSTGESATEVIGAFLRTDYRIVLIAAHGLHGELLHDGTTAVGIPLSDGVMLGAREFEQLRQPPELVFIDAARLARMDSVGLRDEAEMQPQPQPQMHLHSLPDRLLQTGVRAVIAANSDLDDAAATDFCTTFFASLAEPDQTVEQAMLAARRQAYARHPETGVWSAYQLHGAADYRIDSPAQ